MDYRSRAKERFYDKIEFEPNSGCWLWTGFVERYGAFSFKGKMALAHRVSWELHHGPIPGGLHVCHKCDVTACVNPDHLFLGTAEDNAADRDRKCRGRHGPRTKHMGYFGRNNTGPVLFHDI